MRISDWSADVCSSDRNTRPLVASFALGVARASLERIKEIFADQMQYDFSRPVDNGSAIEAEIYRMEADLEASWLLTMKAAWMADNKIGRASCRERVCQYV